MDLKPRPNLEKYLEILRKKTPYERLQQAFMLTERSRELFKAGLRHRHPELDELELHALYLEKLKKCHNRNY